MYQALELNLQQTRFVPLVNQWVWGEGRIGQLRFLVGWQNRHLNQAFSFVLV